MEGRHLTLCYFKGGLTCQYHVGVPCDARNALIASFVRVGGKRRTAGSACVQYKCKLCLTVELHGPRVYLGALGL